MLPGTFAVRFLGGQGFSSDITSAKLTGFSPWGQHIAASYVRERS